MADELDTTGSRIESYIYRHIGSKSAREMATDLGVTPEQVIQVKREMVDSIDEITIQIQKAKLLRSLQELADDARERSKSVSDERNYSGMVNAATGAIDKLLKELNRTAKQDSEALAELNRYRVKELFSLVQETVEVSVVEVAEKYDLDEDLVFAIFNRNLSLAANKREM